MFSRSVTPKHRHPLSFSVTLLTLTTLAATGCSATRPLKGGKAFTAHTPAGAVSQTLLQGDNPSAPSRQAQETVKVRTYTLPAGSRIEQPIGQNASVPLPFDGRGIKGEGNTRPVPSYLSQSGSNATTVFVLAAPMPVTEREETRANTELGAAQKDTAREFGAKLSSLKSLVWVGIALFVSESLRSPGRR